MLYCILWAAWLEINILLTLILTRPATQAPTRKSCTEGTQTQRTPSTNFFYVFVEGVGLQGNINSIRKAYKTVLYEDESEVMETEVKEALRHNYI